MHIQFAELPVADQDRARQFYTERLGCEVVADVPMSEDGWRWIELKLPGAETNLHFQDRRGGSSSSEPVIVFVADDVAAAVADLRARGVAIVTEPEPAPYDPGRTTAMIEDSEGNLIVISS